MKRVRTLLVRAFVGALLLLTLGASAASADPGQWGSDDGGSIQLVLLPQDPGIGE
jgi:hypothetical protein